MSRRRAGTTAGAVHPDRQPALRPGAGPGSVPGARRPGAAAGLLRPLRATADGWMRPSQAHPRPGGRVREAALLRLRRRHLRARRPRPCAAAPAASTPARPAPSPPSASASRSIRTCARAVARAPPPVRPARSPTPIRRLRTGRSPADVLLETYRDAGGAHARGAVARREAGREWLRGDAAALPGHVLPVAVEEVGPWAWRPGLAVLAFGAARVVLLAHDATPASVRAEIDAQMARSPTRVLVASWLRARADRALVGGWSPAASPGVSVPQAGARSADRATFAGVRTSAPCSGSPSTTCTPQPAQPRQLAPLPAHSPFGEILVDSHDLHAVHGLRVGVSGRRGDHRRRRAAAGFRGAELRAVRAVRDRLPGGRHHVEARLLFDREQRAERRDPQRGAAVSLRDLWQALRHHPHHRGMHEKLAGHWMYQDKPERLRRLEMCEDCRVRDMFKDGRRRCCDPRTARSGALIGREQNVPWCAAISGQNVRDPQCHCDPGRLLASLSCGVVCPVSSRRERRGVQGALSSRTGH